MPITQDQLQSPSDIAEGIHHLVDHTEAAATDQLLNLELAGKKSPLEFPRFRGQLSCHPKGYISTNLSAILECYWAVVTNRGMASLRIVVAINPEGQILQQLFGSSQES